MNTTKSIAVSYPGIFLTCLLLASPTAFAGIAGYAQFVNGSVQITDMKGQQRILKKGQAVNEGDTLISAKGANAQIRMQDGGFVAVRPDTQLKFDSFKFSGKEDGSERAIFSLIKGGFRSITGLIGRINKPSYRITTAVATIGIRGTDHETLVVAPGSSLAQAAPAGTYNKVNVGETYIATEKGTIFVLPNQMGYAGASDQMPELRPLNTDLFTVANKPTKEAESEEADGEEVRETAAVDNAAVAAAAPEDEMISPVAKDTQAEIQQPITTTDGENLSGETIVETFAAYTPKHILISMSSGNFSMGNFSRDNYFVDPANITYTAGSPTSFTQVSLDGGWSETFTLFGGSGPINSAAISGATGIQFGRWTSATGMEQSSSWQLGQQWMSADWMYGPQGYLDAGIIALSGTFNYELDASTPVFDSRTGMTGTLSSASLTVDFTNSLLSANIGLTVDGVDWLASTSNASLFGTDFIASTIGGNLTISNGIGNVTLCSICTGYLYGGFTGQNYSGAILSYRLSDGDIFNSNSQGIIGSASLFRVQTVANGTAAPTGSYYVYSGSNGGLQLADTITTSGTLLTSYSWGSAALPESSYYSTTVSCVTCTSNSTTNSANTGIYYGSWDEGSIAQTWGSTFGTAGTFGPTWIAGPEAGPLFLANALVGTKTYSFDGGMVTNGLGVAGTVQNTTTLTVDFDRQVVGVNLDLSVPDTTTGALHSWNATTESVIQSGQGIGGVDFYASSYNTAGAGMLTVTVDGMTPGSGYLSGQLTGIGLNGAIMSYQLDTFQSTTMFEQVSGVAAFVGTSSDIATPRRLVMVSVTEPNLVATSAVHALGFYANSPDRMLTDVSGNLTQFDIDTVANNDSGNANGAMTLNSGTNTLSNAGSDALTGISWGRWDAGSTGSMDVTDRPTGVTTATSLAGSLHWIAGPTETTAVTLPVSGTYSYTHAGGTIPTDNMGNAGTLNSATLSANFTAQTVDIGVNVSVAGANMVGTAANVPIIQSTAFYADSTYPQATPSHLAVTCTGTCGTSAQGAVLGGFTGAGATGAMMSYGFENIGTTSTQVISGVAAFRR
jgi:hypothetical protein